MILFPMMINMQALSTLASWETILAAAKSKNYQSILQLAENVTDGEFPPLKYHKRCRNLFVSRKSKETAEQNKASRSSARGAKDGSSILPTKCIFCKGQKYLKESNTREKLISCCQTRADTTVRNAAMIRDDSIALAITADELIAKEAFCHASCYKSYTAICYRKDHEKNLTEEEKALDEDILAYSLKI